MGKFVESMGSRKATRKEMFVLLQSIHGVLVLFSPSFMAAMGAAATVGGPLADDRAEVQAVPAGGILLAVVLMGFGIMKLLLWL